MSAGFLLGLGATALWALILSRSQRQLWRGPWPPERGNLPTAVWAWGLTTLIYVGLIQTWGQPPALPAALRFGSGLPLIVAGGMVHGWATAVLGLKGTSGWDVGVVTSGPYALCRHPQYLGQIGSLAGVALLIGSFESLALGLAASAMLLYGARVEDRALAARHPDPVAAYRARTPFLLPRLIRP